MSAPVVSSSATCLPSRSVVFQTIVIVAVPYRRSMRGYLALLRTSQTPNETRTHKLQPPGTARSTSPAPHNEGRDQETGGLVELRRVGGGPDL